MTVSLALRQSKDAVWYVYHGAVFTRIEVPLSVLHSYAPQR